MIICPKEAPRFIKTQIIHPHSLPTSSLQCYISTFSPTTPLWNSSATYQHMSQHSEPQHDEYLISSLEFRIWQHLDDHWNGTQLHHLVNIPSVPIDQLFKHMVSSNGPITPFMSTNESIDETASIWTLCSHTGIYVMAIGSLIPTGLGIFFCYFFWYQPAR